MISNQTQELLLRPAGSQVHFSDVFPEIAAGDEPAWWRRTDFDSKLTVAAESAGFPALEQIPIGIRPWMGRYGLLLVDDLLRSRAQRLSNSSTTHPDFAQEASDSEGAVIAVTNYAPRDDENTAGGSNGSDFYLATTSSGLEIYTTPLSFLSGLEARNRITSLYRIPTKGHPEFNGDHEQFRSARIVRTRRHPDHLVPIFEYESTEDLVKAKAEDTHPGVIPVDKRSGHIAFIDKFGNTKVELGDVRQLQELTVGREVVLRVVNNGREYEIPVHVAGDLRSAPLNKLAIYANVSDHIDGSSDTGLIELITRVNSNPSTSTDTAAFQLLRAIPDLDIPTAEVSLTI
ncbi:MAG: hypothetical protein ACOH18_00950 [Candidatus Saccharimonadaceae bacterium]